MEERVSIEKILLIRPVNAKALSPIRLLMALWRKSVTNARKKEKKAMPLWPNGDSEGATARWC